MIIGGPHGGGAARDQQIPRENLRVGDRVKAYC